MLSAEYFFGLSASWGLNADSISVNEKGSQRAARCLNACASSIGFLLCLFRFRSSLLRRGPHGPAAADMDVGFVSRFRATDMRLAAQHLGVTTDDFSHWAPPPILRES
jgi:hypothetical protein